MPVAVSELLDRAEASLQQASFTSDLGERYVAAHLAALRAAAAVLAARTAPSSPSRPRSVWEVLPKLAPDLAEWAAFFAVSGRRRSAIERGDRPVSARQADDLIRQAEAFVQLVHEVLGVDRPGQLALRTQFLVPATRTS
ncbi:MAG: hypothetical protein CSA84_05805 [Actinomycetales bacterium]|nr:MAG: hypothetical protein CSA84_05805 [Actinomycetales bacterium]